eukprot:12833733-Ditylum_brightwellii.AAC.1
MLNLAKSRRSKIVRTSNSKAKTEEHSSLAIQSASSSFWTQDGTDIDGFAESEFGASVSLSGD